MHTPFFQYYILLANFMFMGILPCIVMVTFNVLVVKAVDEANARRARMTRRQQRNITVTSMLVTVVLVFLACHSFKLLLSCYEVYELVTSSPGSNAAEQLEEQETMIYYTTYNDSLDGGNASFYYYDDLYGNGSFNGSFNNTQQLHNPPQQPPPLPRQPVWVEYATAISHWLLILNSSCNIAIYLHKDPKFKAVLKAMARKALRLPETKDNAGDDLDDSKSQGHGGNATSHGNGVRMNNLRSNKPRGINGAAAETAVVAQNVPPASTNNNGGGQLSEGPPSPPVQTCVVIEREGNGHLSNESNVGQSNGSALDSVGSGKKAVLVVSSNGEASKLLCAD